MERSRQRFKPRDEADGDALAGLDTSGFVPSGKLRIETGGRVKQDFNRDQWAIVLGGSSGFGLATAQKLAEQGMSLCVVHRDRRGAMGRIEPEFEKIRGTGVPLITFNKDALDPGKRDEILTELKGAMGADGRVRVLLHSIAFGNLKLIAPEKPPPSSMPGDLADRLGVSAERLTMAADELFEAGADGLHTLAQRPNYPDRSYIDDEDLERTIYSMGTSVLGWAQTLLGRGLFAEDARIFGLTSEGNEVAWKGYAAVAAAKVALESIARSMAVELAPYGIRSNVIQAGVTDTAAQRAIPGAAQLKAQARQRNPFGRLTTPSDVANVIYLLSTAEAAWINGEVIRVDGGEHISGVLR
jgi:NAD(P)-dependent dehydrogenase (short-subunit alcohol dehydrogenase family)